MTTPTSPDLVTKFAEIIEGATPLLFFVNTSFRRIRVQSVEGTEAAIPSRAEPTRLRLFDFGPETAKQSEKMHSDEDRFVIDYIFLLRIYYPEFLATPGQGDLALLEARVKLSDYIVLQRALVESNIFSQVITGASSVVDAGAIFPPGLIEWRFNITQEELTV